MYNTRKFELDEERIVANYFAGIIESVDQSRMTRGALFESPTESVYEVTHEWAPGCSVCSMGAIMDSLLPPEQLTTYVVGNYEGLFMLLRPVVSAATGLPDEDRTEAAIQSVCHKLIDINDSFVGTYRTPDGYEFATFVDIAAKLREFADPSPTIDDVFASVAAKIREFADPSPTTDNVLEIATNGTS